MTDKTSLNKIETQIFTADYCGVCVAEPLRNFALEIVFLHSGHF